MDDPFDITPEEPVRRHNTAAKVTAAVLALAVVAGGIAFVTSSGRGGDEDVAPRSSTTTTTADDTTGDSSTAAGDATAIQTVVPELQRYVEAKRGLAFKRPVEVELLDDAAFRARLKALQDEDRDPPQEIKDTKDVLVALGLLDPDVDLQAVTEKLLGAAVGGFYDPKTDELVVRGSGLDPGVKSTIVHELVHALQDQHFDIVRDNLDDLDDEQSQAFTGLVEGDASAIQQEWLSEQSAADRRAAERSDSDQLGDLGDIPPVLINLLTFPYVVGPRFVEALDDAGGTKRLDAAFANPPKTSEHLLHPERYLDGDDPKILPNPTAEGAVFDEGVIGELGLLLVLSEGANERGTQEAVRAAAGWGGDRYVAWRADGGTCVRFTVEMDDRRESAELAATLTSWAEGRDGTTVTGNGPFTVTACG